MPTASSELQRRHHRQHHSGIASAKVTTAASGLDGSTVV
jgi:hypothetical protein